jgi:sulfite reductase (NADPH) flavoprotein alpha-component
MLPLHSGEYFGIIGQTLMFIASMLMPLFAITGLMLYLNRKRKRNKNSHK